MEEERVVVRLPDAWRDWIITERVGRGSFGTVYRAENRAGDTPLLSAIKIVTVPTNESEADILIRDLKNEETVQLYYRDMVEDYIREITAMNSLKDARNIVRIQDYLVEERSDGPGYVLYIRMEFLTSFPTYREMHPLSPKDVVRLGCDLCRALICCEQQKIIHRDIKPDNIFVSSEGEFKLGDFGVARCLDRSVGTFSAKGTYTFMAPEVLRGEKYGLNADLYSLGLVLYRLMNQNRDPFLDPEKQIVYYKDREMALSRRMSGEKLPDPVDASRAMAAVIRKACAYESGERFQTAAEMLQALERVPEAGSGGSRADLASTVGRRVRRKRRRRSVMVSGWKLGVAIALCVIFALCGAICFVRAGKMLQETRQLREQIEESVKDGAGEGTPEGKTTQTIPVKGEA